MTEPRDGVQMGREAEAVLTLAHPVPATDGSSQIQIRVSSPGLNASATANLEDWNGGRKALIEYFQDLAQSWRGWTDAKEWRDASATCNLSATHDGKGLVVLRVQLRSLPYQWPGHWTTVVDIPLEPGALDQTASAIAQLLT